LRGCDGDEGHRKDGGADEVAKVQGHRDSISTGFTQGGCRDLDDPESQRDLGDFADPSVLVNIHEARPPCLAVIAGDGAVGCGLPGPSRILDGMDNRRQIAPRSFRHFMGELG
jgi:hypothetical protein